MKSIRIRFKKAYSPYNPGDIATFGDRVASAYVNTGLAEFADIRDSIKSIVSPTTKEESKQETVSQVIDTPKKRGRKPNPK